MWLLQRIQGSKSLGGRRTSRSWWRRWRDWHQILKMRVMSRGVRIEGTPSTIRVVVVRLKTVRWIVVFVIIFFVVIFWNKKIRSIRIANNLFLVNFREETKKKSVLKVQKSLIWSDLRQPYPHRCLAPILHCPVNNGRQGGLIIQYLYIIIQGWAQRLINLEIPVLVLSLKSSNVELS